MSSSQRSYGSNSQGYGGNPMSNSARFSDNGQRAASPNVFTNGQPTVRFGDKTACTDTAVPLQGSVFVNGKPIATKGSPTSGHLPCFHPTVIAHGSPNVFAAQGGV